MDDAVPYEDKGVQWLHHDEERVDTPERIENPCVVREPSRQPGRDHQEHQPKGSAGPDPEKEQASRDGCCVLDGNSNRLADHCLTCDREGVESKRQEKPDLEHHLMGGNLRGADPSRYRRRDREDGQESSGADHQRTARTEERADFAASRPTRCQPEISPPSPHQGDEPDGAGPLCDDCGPCGACDPSAEAENENGIEHEIDHVQTERHHKRCPGVLESPKDTVRHCDEHDRRQRQGSYS